LKYDFNSELRIQNSEGRFGRKLLKRLRRKLFGIFNPEPGCFGFAIRNSVLGNFCLKHHSRLCQWKERFRAEKVCGGRRGMCFSFLCFLAYLWSPVSRSGFSGLTKKNRIENETSVLSKNRPKRWLVFRIANPKTAGFGIENPEQHSRFGQKSSNPAMGENTRNARLNS
jgi:hypothetical protein